MGFKSFPFVFSLLSILTFNSCGEFQEMQRAKFIDFGSSGMTQHYEYVFHPIDSLVNNRENTTFSLDIVVRFSQLYSHKNLPLLIEYTSLERDTVTQKNLVIPLFEEDNDISDNYMYGIRNCEINLIPQLKYEEGFYVSISTHETDTTGILSLGIVLKELNNGTNTE